MATGMADINLSLGGKSDQFSMSCYVEGKLALLRLLPRCSECRAVLVHRTYLYISVTQTLQRLFNYRGAGNSNIRAWLYGASSQIPNSVFLHLPEVSIYSDLFSL